MDDTNSPAFDFQTKEALKEDEKAETESSEDIDTPISLLLQTVGHEPGIMLSNEKKEVNLLDV